MKIKKIQNIKTTIKTTKYAFNIIFRKKNGRIFILYQNICAIIDVFPPIILAIFPGLIINELIQEKRVYQLILYVCCLLVVPVLLRFLKMFLEICASKYGKSFNRDITSDFYDHVMSMDYATVENPEIQQIKERVSDTLSNVLNVSSGMTALLSAVVRLVLISSIISILNPLIILLVIAMLIINSATIKKTNLKTHEISIELSNNDRFLWAYSYMMGHLAYAKEVRLFKLNQLLISGYEKFKSENDKKEIDMLKISRGRDLVFLLTDFIQQVGLYVYLIIDVLIKGLPIGSMTIYLSTVGQFSGALNYVFNSYLNLENESLKIQELMSFMDMPLNTNKIGRIIPRFDKDSVIEFQHVSFVYPGSSRYALKDINLTLKCNEKLCFVGINGSGKSTLVKLLTRLYAPTEGKVLLNGIDINQYDYIEYQRLFSPVFQDFVRYYFSLGENIVLASEYSQKLLDDVCRHSGLDLLVQKLPNGYDTPASKFLDETGFEPSGGEAQKIAIARALYHGGEIYILDEPTAALDPNAEYEIYTQFHNMIKDKTAILVTHRLSAVQLADKVAVFDDGQIIEYGTHSELYAKGGKYKEMFDKQSEFYVKAANETEQQNNS